MADLLLEGVRKTYPGTIALDGVAVRFRAGEIHALLGGNGSGKSTLTKILAGVEIADAGTISLDGDQQPLRQHTPERAHAAGLRFVHQRPSTFGTLSVAENLALGSHFETGRLGRIRWRAQGRAAVRLLERFEIEASPHQLVEDLPPSTRTLISIARALRDQEDATTGILVLDEPTASLPDRDAETLLRALRRYAEGGQTIVHITHRLAEVLAVADRVTVLRDGQVAGELAGDALEHACLVELIVGGAGGTHEPTRTYDEATGPMSLQVVGVPTTPDASIDLAVRKGEIVGVTGLIGAGSVGALRALAGVNGAVEAIVDGRRTRLDSRAASLRAGIAYLPGHRSDAAFFDHTVAENLALAHPRSYFRGGRMRDRAARKDAREVIRRYRVKAPSPDAVMSTLSGGNQQKVLLARLVELSPAVLLLDEPTHGVDVGARRELHEVVRRVAAEGAAVIVSSTDAEELAQLCHRCVVLVDGSAAGELAGAAMTPDAINRLSYGKAVR